MDEKYLVPPRFKYSPKIWREFSIKSMAYFMVMCYPAVLILKSGLNVTLKVVLSIPFVATAWFLASYEKYGEGVEAVIFHWALHHLTPRSYRLFRASESDRRRPTTELVPIARIHEDMVEFTGGVFCRVVTVPSLNYELMSDQEKRAAEASFRELCHSLAVGFPLQTFMRSRRLLYEDLEAAASSSPATGVYRQARDEYLAFLKGLTGEGRLHAKEFYIIIPFNSYALPRNQQGPSAYLSFIKSYFGRSQERRRIADVGEQIKQRTDIVMEGLRRCRLEGTVLRRPELAQLINDELNPDLEGDPSRRSDIRAALEGLDSEQLRQMLAPSAVDLAADHIKIGNLYTRILTIYEWPTHLFPGWVQTVNDLADDLDVSLHIAPRNMAADVRILSAQVKKMHQSAMGERLAGFADDQLTLVQQEKSESFMRRFASGEEKTFDFIILVAVKAASLEELDDKTASVASKLAAREMVVDVPRHQMKDAFLSWLPFGMQRLPIDRPFTSSLLGASFPLASKDMSAGGGILFGVSDDGGSIITVDRHRLSNANMVIAGMSGAGKSVFGKAILTRSLATGCQAVVIDVESEFAALCERLAGQRVVVAPGSESSINPLDRNFRLSDKSISGLDNLVRENMNFLRLLMADGEMAWRPLEAEELIFTLYRRCDNPLLADLRDLAREMGMSDIERALYPWVDGSMRGLFDRPTSVDLDNPLVVFDISRMRKEHRALAISTIDSWFWKRIRADRVPRIFLLDEASWLLRDEECAFAFEQIARRGRKYGTGFILIDQALDQLFAHERSRAIVSNCATKALFYMDRGLVDEYVSRAINLTAREKELIMTLGTGECILHAGPHRARIKVKISSSELALFDTSPQGGRGVA